MILDKNYSETARMKFSGHIKRDTFETLTLTALSRLMEQQISLGSEADVVISRTIVVWASAVIPISIKPSQQGQSLNFRKIAVPPADIQLLLYNLAFPFKLNVTEKSDRVPPFADYDFLGINL